ncbi:hypothetical protein [Agromyces larvae]|uniref:DUF4345 domain-containing protein n=1 Tax=Agromyces larvae TaxID=2929802 RepID=A0ABY4BXX3_9MICO|nr:hypothetical protein [Agromyces larvae]UOE42721.1 hypothetical protein MTO99_11015 [Agromyces larvae]
MIKIDSPMAENRPRPAVSHLHVGRLALTYGIGAALLLLPLAFTIEGIAVACTYAGNSDPTSQGHVREAMLQAELAGTFGVIVLTGCTIVAGMLARQARLNVLVVTLTGAVLMLLVTLPVSWLLVRPVGGAWLT